MTQASNGAPPATPGYAAGTAGHLGRKTCVGQRVADPESQWQHTDAGMEAAELAELRKLFDRASMGNAVNTGSYAKFLMAQENQKIAEAARAEREKRRLRKEEEMEAQRVRTQELRIKRGNRDGEARERLVVRNHLEAAQIKRAEDNWRRAIRTSNIPLRPPLRLSTVHQHMCITPLHSAPLLAPPVRPRRRRQQRDAANRSYYEEARRVAYGCGRGRRARVGRGVMWWEGGTSIIPAPTHTQARKNVVEASKLDAKLDKAEAAQA